MINKEEKADGLKKNYKEDWKQRDMKKKMHRSQTHQQC